MEINAISQQPNFGYGAVSARKVGVIGKVNGKMTQVASYTNFAENLSNYKAVVKKLPYDSVKNQTEDTLFLIPKNFVEVQDKDDPTKTKKVPYYFGNIIRIDCEKGKGQEVREMLKKGIQEASDKTRYEIPQ